MSSVFNVVGTGGTVLNLTTAAPGGVQLALNGLIGTRTAGIGLPDAHYMGFYAAGLYFYNSGVNMLVLKDTAITVKANILASGSINIGAAANRFAVGMFSTVLGTHDTKNYKDVLLQVCDKLQVNCRRNALPTDGLLAQFGAGAYNYIASYQTWTATAGGAVTAGWVSSIKAYGIHTYMVRAAISDSTVDSFYYGENDGGNNYFTIEKGTNAGTYKFSTDNNSGVAEITDNLTPDPNVDGTFKVTVENGSTKLFVNGSLKATHATKPTPINVILTGYAYAKAGAAYVLTLYEIYQWLGVAL